MLKVVQIIHPAHAALPRGAVPADAAEILRITPSFDGVSGGLPVRWNSPSRQHYRGLSRAVRAFAPDVIHLHASPASVLAMQVSRLRNRALPGCALVLECEHAVTAGVPWQWRWLARRVLGQTDAVLARHLDGIAALRRLGFDGLGSVAGTGGAAVVPLPSRAEARAALGLTDPACAVIGFAGPLTAEAGLLDALEAVAACPSELVLLVLGRGPLRDELADRAAALDISHRLHFADPGGPDRLVAANPDLRGHPNMLAVLDAVLAVPRPGAAADGPFDRMIETAQMHGVPVIASAVPGLAEIVGPGGWITEAQDPGLLCRMLHDLADQPERFAGPAALARQHAGRRHSPGAHAAALTRAMLAAQASRLQRRPASIRSGGVLKRQADL